MSQNLSCFARRSLIFLRNKISFSLAKVPAVRYVTQPPTTTATTSCLSSRKGATNNETKATPTQSPTACHDPPLSEKSPSGDRLSRKHVQFPDTSTSSNQIHRPGKRVRFRPRLYNVSGRERDRERGKRERDPKLDLQMCHRGVRRRREDVTFLLSLVHMCTYIHPV